MTHGHRHTSRAIATAVALAVAATGCTGQEDTDGVRNVRGVGFRIEVPQGWEEPADGSEQVAGSWLGPLQDDGTRVGVWVETACLAGSFDGEVAFLQSPGANFDGYEVVEPAIEVDVTDADHAVEWQVAYEQPMAQDGAVATIRRIQLLAALEDDSTAHVVYEGRDRHVDLGQARAIVRSVELEVLGCDDGEVGA